MTDEQEKDTGQAEAHENDNEPAKQPSISDILRSGGFRTTYTIQNMRRLRRPDLGSSGG